MRKLSFVKALDCFFLSVPSNNGCFCLNSAEAAEAEEDDFERTTLMKKKGALVEENKTLAYQLLPKTVALRVSMHCNGCARKVQKHIKKIEGVKSIEMNLVSKKVVVTGNITPFELLESVSKIKRAELWPES